MKVGPEINAWSENQNTSGRTDEAWFAQELSFVTQILPSPDFPAPWRAGGSTGCCSSGWTLAALAAKQKCN